MPKLSRRMPILKTLKGSYFMNLIRKVEKIVYLNVFLLLSGCSSSNYLQDLEKESINSKSALHSRKSNEAKKIIGSTRSATSGIYSLKGKIPASTVNLYDVLANGKNYLDKSLISSKFNSSYNKNKYNIWKNKGINYKDEFSKRDYENNIIKKISDINTDFIKLPQYVLVDVTFKTSQQQYIFNSNILRFVPQPLPENDIKIRGSIAGISGLPSIVDCYYSSIEALKIDQYLSRELNIKNIGVIAAQQKPQAVGVLRISENDARLLFNSKETASFQGSILYRVTSGLVDYSTTSCLGGSAIMFDIEPLMYFISDINGKAYEVNEFQDISSGIGVKSFKGASFPIN